MDRLFLDANVLFSAAYGSPRILEFWQLCKKRRCRLLATQYVMEEAKRNLHAPEQLRRLDTLQREITIVPEAPEGLSCRVKLPPGDQRVLLGAVAAGASHLVTGDVKHFGPYYGTKVHGVCIVLPSMYLQPSRKQR